MSVFKVTSSSNMPLTLRDGRGFNKPSVSLAFGVPEFFLNPPLPSPEIKIEKIDDSKIEAEVRKKHNAFALAYKKAREFKSQQVRNFDVGTQPDDTNELMKHELFKMGVDGGKKMAKRIVTFNVSDAAKDELSQAALDRVEQEASIMDKAPPLPEPRK